jgi:hypothetical protein
MALLTNAPAASAAVALTNALRDIKPPLEIASGWEWLWWTLGTLALLGLLFGVALFIFKRRRQVVMTPPVPPHVRARLALEESLKLLRLPKPFVIAVSDTLRGYLEERFTFRAPERTTEEFLHELQGTPLLDDTQKQSLAGFLQQCDLVKFARYEPAERELRELHGSAVRLVDETEPRPESALDAQTTPAGPQS